MPYIKQSYRQILEPNLIGLFDALEDIYQEDELSKDGCFNYCVTRLALKLFGKKGYSQFVRIAGNLEEIKAEYRRRVVIPYEDEKINTNGDVYDEINR